MALFNVSIEKERALLQRMEKLGIRESDITERFVKGSGHGGQKINKTSSCVHLTHEPTGIEVKCQRDRSQSLNRFLARRDLCDKIEALHEGHRSEREQAIEKIRRQKRKRSKRSKEKMLRAKAHRGQVKVARRMPGGVE
ncbi:MAG: peptide chain release factor-like protein [Proteobacteria bacterium]|nr:peptide chain release factor-like protein [Pseudomonadota bacterium]